MKDPMEVHNIRRKDNESIEDFITRFNKASMGVEGAGDQLRISGFCHGVKCAQLVEKLHEDLPRSMDVLMDKARAFVRGKNACAYLSNVNGGSGQMRQNSMVTGRTNGGPVRAMGHFSQNKWVKGFHSRGKNFGGSSGHAHGDYKGAKLIELVKTPTQILAIEKVDLHAPPKMQNALTRNLDKYCEYHKDRGHTTDTCWTLKKEIDKAVRLGKLGHLVKVIRNNFPGGDALVINMVQIQGSDLCRNVRRRSNKQIGWKYQEITFPPILEQMATEEPIVVSARTGGFMVKRIHVDCGSATEIMYEQFFRQMGFTTCGQLRPTTVPLVGFAGEVVRPIGEITLPMVIGNGLQMRQLEVTFLVVSASSVHNVILGRPMLRRLGAVISVMHGMMRFPTPGGVATLSADPGIQVCNVDIHTCLDRVDKEEIVKEKWAINLKFPDQKLQIGTELSGNARERLYALLKKNVDVFAWEPSDMTGVPRTISEHMLALYPGSKPVQQRQRGMDTERANAVNEEVAKLVEAGILREVQYTDWVSNPVLVKKPDGSWRMCIDFKDVNNACPKDCYPLPEIDLKVDSVVGFQWKCFLDAYKGYHQIQMAKEDEDKTAFITRKEAEDAFKQLKEFLVTLPTLTAPVVGEILQMYLAVSEGAVSSVLVAERGQKQMPIYYVSKVLKDYEMRYSPMEKLVYALVLSARRLRRYFQAHTVEILTTSSINQVLRRHEVSVKMVKWAVELGQYDIQFKPRTAIKGQVVADFLAEMPVGNNKACTAKTNSNIFENASRQVWSLFTDGSSGENGAGAGLLLISPERDELTYALKFDFNVSNNEEEYEALLAG
ncbi:hypothetical protein SSX86_001652 [Deinandra increscens subsp. villosa]|uniref:Reverse transcriptase/retrotransposon-derived protein RNase H-like domain-containing protein n=1 Tax=Deinandra increscens subsp. villosa TaxID=3103831 RepID=A0AAP0HCU7_9ASTR